MRLQDRHDRYIDYLRISVTDRCNMSCIYCKPRSGLKVLPHEDILRYDEILRLAKVVVPLGITHLRITGGEPLIRRGLVDFIAGLSRIPGIEDISLTTNGVLLEDMAADLKRSGVSRLNISLDTLRPQRFREITGRDEWDRVWRGILKAEELGFDPIKINMVPIKGVNDDEIADFARLTMEMRIHVRFIEFMPIGARDRWSMDTCVTSGRAREIIESEIGPLSCVSRAEGAGPSDNYRAQGAKGVIGFISPITKHFCSSCRRLRLTPDGKIRPCLLSDTEIDIKLPMRGGCDDREIERLLRLALEIKPERHYIGRGEVPTGCYQRTVSAIGG